MQNVFAQWSLDASILRQHGRGDLDPEVVRIAKRTSALVG